MLSQHKFKLNPYILINLLLLLTTSTLLSISPVEGAQGVTGKKAVVVVLDQVGCSDLMQGQAPALMNLAKEVGGVGLINIRPKEVFNSRAASSYLSIGAGTRIQAPEGDVLISSQGGEYVAAIDNHQLINGWMDISPSIGKLGKAARLNNIKIGIIGTKNNPNLALMGMDNQGRIPLVIDDVPSTPKELLKDTLALLGQGDLIIVDGGGAGKVPLLDSYLRELVHKLDMDKTLLMIISPQTSKTMVKKDLNNGLTPIFLLGGANENGILTSQTTRRDGVVSSLDVAPTLLEFFTGDSPGWLGKEMKVQGEGNNVSQVAKLEQSIIGLNKTRYLMHGFILILMALSLLTLFHSRFTLLKDPEFLSLTTLATPLASLAAGWVDNYNYYILSVMGIMLVSLVIAFMVKAWFRDFLRAATIIALITALIIIVESMVGTEYILASPFGYNDLIIGGRYYGLNNDIMGILLGAAGLGVYGLAQWFRLSPQILGVLNLLVFGSCILALSPLFGSNVGGTMTALAMLMVGIWVSFNRRLNIWSLITIFLMVISIQVGIAALDARYNPSLTHAGRAVQSLSEGGLGTFIEIVSSKLSQVFLMLLLPPWNLALAGQVGILLWIRLKHFKLVLETINTYPTLYKGFQVLLMGSIVVFMFNDTGVISAALIFNYLLLPLGIMMAGRINRPPAPQFTEGQFLKG